MDIGIVIALLLGFIGAINTFQLFISKELSDRLRAMEQNFIKHIEDRH